ncbi:IclR family transcriptional regulator [Eoetvoesiella caeni]
MTTERSSSIERMLAIPRLFTEERPVWSVEEVANELRLSISTAYRYFQSLIKFEYLDEIPNRGYCLGPAFIEFDRIIRVTDPLSHAAGPIISGLAPAMPLGTSLILCQVYQKKVMCIHHETVGPAGEGISYQRGKPMPFYRGATSKVILAHMPWRQQKREYESHTQELQQAGLGNDWKSFSLGLRNIRKRGYCVSRGEVDLGRMGIAAPIFSGNGHVSHSLSAVAWQDQIDQASEDRLVTSIVMAAARISEAMARANGSPEAAAPKQKP